MFATAVGYAIQSIEAGNLSASGALRGRGQGTRRAATSSTYCSSSIDPSAFRLPMSSAGGRYEHTGFDLFFSSGLTNNLPAMIPVTLLYGTPDDAAAEIAYVEKRGYPVAYIEMGEEPDGKARHARGLRHPLHPVGRSDSQGGSQSQARRADLSKASIKTSGVARRPRSNFLDGPLYRLFEGSRPSRRIWPSSPSKLEHYPFEPCGRDLESTVPRNRN